jgi:hypothetical protein
LESTFKQLCETLEAQIQDSYTNGVTLDGAEKLAGEFLHAQIKVSGELKGADLDSRMRKTGLKSIKAAIYMDAATKGEKKPTEAALAAIVDMNDIVQGEQKAFDEADVNKAELERYYDIFREAHIYYRGIAKGKFE